ncbi:MAG TPA: hypothetical protein VK818_13850 [Methylomirabilota bacterium]|jgi:hypothetical protein|nr:hypothetical protein [Methylomirabilota bacterium]
MTILTLALTFLLFADADVPQVNSLRPPASSNLGTFPGDEIPLFGNDPSDTDSQNQAGAQDKSQNVGKDTSLQDSSRLNLIRYVSGEFARAIKPLPAGKDGFIVHIGQPADFDMLDRQVATHGAAVSTGDHVQITKLEFHEKQIVVDLNGGGRGKKRLRDRIHLDMGGIPTTRTTTTTPQDSGPPGMQPGLGSTLFLEFGKPLPDLSPDDLKKLLAPFLDFTKQRSASVQWFDTLPIEMKKAIQERKPVVGMDREEVVAAIGKPEHKVRERDAEGNDIEDWIYGQPPSKTVFVRFTGTRVTSVKQYPQ